MPAFMKCGDIKGEAQDQNHKDWILLESMSSPIHRTIPQGATENTRDRGDTILGDVVIVRHVDSSSVKMQEACATGKPQNEVEVHFCQIVGGKADPYLKYKLKNVILTGYNFHGNSSGDPLPTEEVTLNFTEAEWTYVKFDAQGKPAGNVVGKYNLGQRKGS